MPKIWIEVSDDKEYCARCDYESGSRIKSQCEIFGVELHKGEGWLFYKCAQCVEASKEDNAKCSKEVGDAYWHGHRDAIKEIASKEQGNKGIDSGQ